jgi:hypothetical protein
MSTPKIVTTRQDPATFEALVKQYPAHIAELSRASAPATAPARRR